MSRWNDDEWSLKRPVLTRETPADTERLRAFLERFDKGADPAPMPELDITNADHIACLLSENLRVENLRIEGIPFVAVQIAEAIDRLLAGRAALTGKQENMEEGR